MSISADEVLWCYRLLLGREPESEAVVAQYTAMPHREALIQAFLDSEEFGRRGVNVRSVLSSLNRFDDQPLRVDVSVTAVQLAALLLRVKACWSQLGETQPHWSVMSNDKFRPEHIGQNIEQFWKSGQRSVNKLLTVLRRVGCERLDSKLCVEYGCGVGRMTPHLAAVFGQVVGYDISASHLALAQQRARELGIGNIDYRLVAEDPLAALAPCDVYISQLVLQHNPPPLIAQLLKNALDALKPGGFGVFQVSTHVAGYRFVIDEYLAAAPGAPQTFEIHHLPQAEVFALVTAHGCRLLEVHEDGASGDAQACVSNLFVVQKTR